LNCINDTNIGLSLDAANSEVDAAIVFGSQN
jgi:hypothetical protein